MKTKPHMLQLGRSAGNTRMIKFNNSWLCHAIKRFNVFSILPELKYNIFQKEFCCLNVDLAQHLAL